MNITPETEKKLWAAAKASRISDIPGFPLASHAALKAAIATGEAQLGIEYAAARDLVPISKSASASALILALTWVMPALAIGSIILAILTGNWWALFGVVSSFLGQTLANPYNPAKALGKILVAAALLHIIVAGSIVRGLTWASFSFAASAIALWTLNRLAWRWAHAAVLASEAVAAHLFRTRNLHIRDSGGKIHDAHANGQP
jgi:hypothetical protein